MRLVAFRKRLNKRINNMRRTSMEQLIQEWRASLPKFREMTEKFYAKEVSVKEYKGFSGGYGSYAQKGGKASMLRLRMPGGRLTKEKLKFIAEMVEQYHVDKAHFTTCQAVQLHDLDKDSVCDIMEKAVDVGIITKGGGGDFPRNVMCSPLSGVEMGEYFDVLPYAEAVSDYLLKNADKVTMPRKLKVGFSNSPANVTHATFRDLGFVAAEDGTFTVYSAGGLGNNPRMGVKVAENVEPSQILYYVQAMVNTFLAYGNYENRGKARTRYMQEKLGSEGYVKAFLEKLEEVKKNEKLDLNLAVSGTEKAADGELQTENKRIVAQKQPGLYAVKYHPIGGVPKVSKFGEIYESIKDVSDAEIRISPDETVYIINLTAKEAEKVLAATDDGAETLFESSVSCIGATICQVGVRDSQGLLRRLVETAKEYDFADGVLPQIHISGCTSSCGTHQIGKIGFHGGVKRIDSVTEPVFTLHVNGCDRQGQEAFGESWGMIKESDIPDFLMEVGKTVQQENTVFATWYEKTPEKLKEIAEKYLINSSRTHVRLGA